MPPSIITILIKCHGADLPSESFNDPTVRIISFAGRSGSIFSATPQYKNEVKQTFAEQFTAYSRKIPTKGKKKFMAQLYQDNPGANRCENTPMFSLDESTSKPLSTAQFLMDSFVNPSQHMSELSDIDIYHSFPVYNKNTQRRFEMRKEGNIPQREQFTYEDAVENKTFRMHTPVINHLYSFTDPEDPNVPIQHGFGIHVYDICNYDRKVDGHVNIKIEDNLIKAKSRASFNSEFASTVKDADDSITLEHLCDYLHSIGFHTINILDSSCRYAGECYDRETRKRVTEMEDDQFSQIDLAYGRKAKAKAKSKKQKKGISIKAKKRPSNTRKYRTKKLN